MYVQVSGEPSTRNPDFSSNGVNQGILKYRPDKFVPFKVPVFDETASLLQEQAYKKAKKEQPTRTFTKPKPIYWWAYRPELQFSVYELAVSEIQPAYGEQVGDNVLEDDKPIINSRDGFLEAPTSSDEFLRLIYDLQSNENDALSGYSFDGEKELIFALGEQELRASVTQGGGSTQILEFDDLSVLSGLDPEDFLTMRMYLNNDAANILWEWAFSGEGRVVRRSLAEGKRSGSKRNIKSLLRDDYFYPALGDKKLFVDMLGLGKDDKVRIIKISDSTLKTTPAINVSTSFHEGYAKFLLHGGDSVSPEDHDDTTPVKITFRIFPVNDKFIDVTTEVIVKSNRNTPLSELLDGSAVWTNVDHIPDWSSKSDEKKGQLTGQTQSPGDASFGPDYQYFDYGQYMMNMVTIPLAMPVQESNLKYSIKPDGIFEETTRKLLEALMGNTVNAPIPEYGDQSLRDVGMNIGHHDNDFVDDTLLPNNTEIRSFRKLLQDYQAVEDRPDIMDQEVQIALELESDFKKIPRLATADHVYKIMTPELLRGRVLNAAETRVIAAGSDSSSGVFTDQDLGLYEMFRSYDWDGDGVSNLAEVENATRWSYSESGQASKSIESGVFNPLSPIDTALGEQLKGAFSRGYGGVAGTADTIQKYGRGEIAILKNGTPIVIQGLRLPHLGSGYYHYHGGDPAQSDAYTTLPMLRKLERIGRNWHNKLAEKSFVVDNPASESSSHQRMPLGDISAPGGGENKYISAGSFPGKEPEYGTRRSEHPYMFLNHAGHENGTEMDLRYLQSNGEGKITLPSSNYDQDNTIELLREFINQGATVLYVNDPETRTALIDDHPGLLIKHQGGHNNHFHVRFESPNPIRLGQISAEESLEYNSIEPETVTYTYTIVDSMGVAMPEHTLLYVREELANNIPSNSDLVSIAITGTGAVVPLRTDSNGQISLPIKPKAAGTAVIGIYRAATISDVSGINDTAASELDTSQEVGSLILTIESSEVPQG